MTRTINEGFRIFHSQLTPSGNESEAAKGHRASIEDVLKKNFKIISFFRTGSFGNGTSIRGYSDVDYFAIIPSEKVKSNSSTMLREVRDVLDNRFPRTGVRTNTPAVLVPFGADVSENTEVVPAKIIRFDAESEHLIYGIADGSGDWIESATRSHNDYISSLNNELNNDLKPIIRFIKAWKYFKNVPISSFYLELFIANYFKYRTKIWYASDFQGIIKSLYDKDLPDVSDPLGISDDISPCSSTAKWSDALVKLITAKNRVNNACEAEEDNNIKDAFYWWNRLFADKFPAYE